MRSNLTQALHKRSPYVGSPEAAKSGLAVLRETEFAMWLPKYAAIAQGLLRWQRQPQVRSYLEEFAMTKRQFAASQR